MNTQEAKAASRKSAKGHYLGCLYHNAFWGATSSPIIGEDVSVMDANTLIRNGMALIHAKADGTCYLSRTKKGSKIYDANAQHYHFFHGGSSIKVGTAYPRYKKTGPVDMVEKMNNVAKYHPRLLRAL